MQLVRLRATAVPLGLGPVPPDTIFIGAFSKGEDGNAVLNYGPTASVFAPRTYFEAHPIDASGELQPFDHEWETVEFDFTYDDSKPLIPAMLVTAAKEHYNSLTQSA